MAAGNVHDWNKAAAKVAVSFRVPIWLRSEGGMPGLPCCCIFFFSLSLSLSVCFLSLLLDHRLLQKPSPKTILAHGLPEASFGL